MLAWLHGHWLVYQRFADKTLEPTSDCLNKLEVLFSFDRDLSLGFNQFRDVGIFRGPVRLKL